MFDIRRATDLYKLSLTDPRNAMPYLQQAADNGDALVRLTSSIQLAHLAPAEVPAYAVAQMLPILLDVSAGECLSLTDAYTKVTDAGGEWWDLGQHLALALARLPAGSAPFAVPKLVALWRRDPQFYEAILAAVALAFPEGGRPTDASLRNGGRIVCEALVESRIIWTHCEDTPEMLTGRGLPGTRDGLHALLSSRYR